MGDEFGSRNDDPRPVHPNGDVHCPVDNEWVNVRCWKCGWRRTGVGPDTPTETRVGGGPSYREDGSIAYDPSAAPEVPGEPVPALPVPPDGWLQFGTLAGAGVPVEFSDEVDEVGEPLWERVARPALPDALAAVDAMADHVTSYLLIAEWPIDWREVMSGAFMAGADAIRAAARPALPDDTAALREAVEVAQDEYRIIRDRLNHIRPLWREAVDSIVAIRALAEATEDRPAYAPGASWLRTADVLALLPAAVPLGPEPTTEWPPKVHKFTYPAIDGPEPTIEGGKT